jgi:peptide deformylase
MPLIQNDRTILSQKSDECTTIEEIAEIDKLLREEFKKYRDAYALAAPQLGIFKRVFITPINGKLTTVVHPKILKQSEERKETIEGCLSFPGTKILTNRPIIIDVTDATEKTITLSGMEAVGFQHEYDHLEGVTFHNVGMIVDHPLAIGSSIGRNSFCPCGSGKKYKKCHGI